MRSLAVAAVALLCAAAAAAAPTVAPRTATLLAVGDVADCRSDGDEAVADLVATLPGTIAILGDAVYERATADEIRDCWEPAWGRFRSRVRVALGNHEYGTGNADAAIRAFGLPGRGWYAYTAGAWRVFVLDSNCRHAGGCRPGSPQWQWLRGALAATRARCVLAYWHHPRWSSGFHGSDRTVDPLWRLLARARADVVLAGHDHHYERFAPIDGIRSFVVGTGGRSHYPTLLPRRGSERRDSRTFGVLRLTLRPGGYDWRFVPVAGATFTDAGSGRCR